MPVAYFLAYAGMAYDLVVGFLLLFKRTLVPAVLASIFFHLANKVAFNIGTRHSFAALEPRHSLS